MLDKHEEESVWIEQAKRGNPHAIDALTHRYKALLWSLALRMDCDRNAVEELVQAGVVGFLHAIERYDQEKKTKLITYAVPWILGEMKRALRSMYEAHRWLSLDGSSSPDEQITIMEQIGVREFDDETFDLRMAMNRLKSDEQKVICLRYYRDKTQRETADLLRKSQAQISRIEREALGKLKGMLR